MTRALVAAVLLVVFVATILATLPVGPAIRWRLASAGIDDDTLAFESARLSWDGIVLGQVTVAPPAGGRLELPWLRVQPSVASLLRGGNGLPATTVAPLCGGWMDGRLESAAPGWRVTGVWADVDLAACPEALIVPGALAGRVQGRIDLTIAGANARHGTGVLRLRDLDWEAPGVPRHLPTRADVAEIQWDVDGRTVTLRRVEVHNEEFDATATGTVDVAQPLVDSDIRIDLAVHPRPRMPQAHRDFLMALPGGPPDRAGARRFRLRGVLGAPVVARGG